MSEKTDKPAISPELRQKNTFRIHLPAWLGRPGAEFLIRTAATALAFWVVFTFVIGVHICHSQ